MKNFEKISANIPADIIDSAKTLANIQGVPLSQLLTDLLKIAVDRNKNVIEKFKADQLAARQACVLDVAAPSADKTTDAD